MSQQDYGHQLETGVRLRSVVVEARVSTFFIDVDTGAIAMPRRMLNQGITPGGAVRIEAVY